MLIWMDSVPISLNDGYNPLLSLIGFALWSQQEDARSQ